jgi:hypothetical protein
MSPVVPAVAAPAIVRRPVIPSAVTWDVCVDVWGTGGSWGRPRATRLADVARIANIAGIAVSVAITVALAVLAGRTVISAVAVVVCRRRRTRGKAPLARHDPVTLPGWPPVVTISIVPPAAVHAVAAVEGVTAVEAGRGSVRLGAHADCAPLRSWWQRRLAIVELAPVELVALFEDGNLTRLYRKRGRLEVGMLERVNGVDALSPVQLEELFHERDGTRAILPEPGGKVSRAGSWCHALGVGQGVEQGHVLGGG